MYIAFYIIAQPGTDPDNKIFITLSNKNAINTDKSKPPKLGTIRFIGFKNGSVN
jgi:hypothetical protein